MAILHDPSIRANIEARFSSLAPTSQRRWGTMSVDQMLWHVNASLEMALGLRAPTQETSPIPRPIVRFLVLYGPWPKGAPTNRGSIPQSTYEFDTERSRTLSLIEQFVARDLDAAWPEQPVFGQMRGRHWSRLQARHLDHHLRQFGV